MSEDKNTEKTNSPACAGCKHQRKKCVVGCVLSKHFPANRMDVFKLIHQVFGVSNVTKMLRKLDEQQQNEAVKSLIWEAQQWEVDPMRGPYGQYRELKQEFMALREERNAQLQHVQRLLQLNLPQSSTPQIGYVTGRGENGVEASSSSAIVPPGGNTQNYVVNNYENRMLPMPVNRRLGNSTPSSSYTSQAMAIGQEQIGVMAPGIGFRLPSQHTILQEHNRSQVMDNQGRTRLVEQNSLHAATFARRLGIVQDVPAAAAQPGENQPTTRHGGEDLSAIHRQRF